jgi:diguanylate cyclase (GGDEF)-like protein/PAS domain S-box-containing protein
MPSFQDPEIYRDILDGLQIGVSVLDRQKKIVFWSDGAERISGHARIDVLGHPCTDNIFPHCNQTRCEACTERCLLTTALHDAKMVEAMSFIHHKSGHRAPVHTRAVPLRDRHGSIIGIIQTFDGMPTAAAPDPNHQSTNPRGCLDDLTGLPNQAMMLSHVRETLATSADLQIPFGLVCLEVHEFNQFRARYGQEAARSLLQVLAQTLRNTVWPTDFVGSWSEGQFLVILSGCGEDALQAVSARMLKMMAGATIQWWGEELSVTVSIGRTAAVAGDTIESLLHRAQDALSGNQVALPNRAAAADGANPPSGT